MKIIKILIGLLIIANLAMAANNVEVHINYPSDTVFIGSYNKIEIWIENDDSVYAISMGYEFTGTLESIIWDTAYGCAGMANSENDARNSLQLYCTGDGLSNTSLPDSIRMGAFYMPPYYRGLPAHSARECFSMYFYVPDGESPGQFCIDNIWMPPGVDWAFLDHIGYVIPSYQGCEENDPSNPACPAVCFPVATTTRPCGDFNGNGNVSVSDLTAIVNYIMLSNPPGPIGYAFGDVNCDGRVNMADAEFIAEYLFIGGPVPCSNCP